MAKKNRSRRPAEAAGDTDVTTSRARRSRPPRPARRQPERGLLERYSGLLVAGLAVVGVLVIVFFLFGSGARGAYECESLLTPGPVETISPRPVTPSPIASPSPTGAPTQSPAASPSPGAESPSPEPSPAPEPTPRLGFTTGDLGVQHVPHPQPITYGFCPPTSGAHYSGAGVGPIRPAFYPPTEERAPGGWVHNLEHGYVVALYSCPDGECPTDAELNQLRRFTEEAPLSRVAPSCPSKVLAARFDEMQTQFAMVAWGRALLMDEFDLDTALTFAEQWIDHEAVPERGACP